MEEIEQIQNNQVLGLPYRINDLGAVLDSHNQKLTTWFTTPGQDAYLVACANAAPGLVEEVRRLRAILAHWNGADAVREFEKGGAE